MVNLSNIQWTEVIVGLMTLCGTLLTGALTLIGVLYGTSIQRNKIAQETRGLLIDQQVKRGEIDAQVQESLIRLNTELEQKVSELKSEAKDLREEMRGLKDDKRILEERLLDVQKKYDAILLEYQGLIAVNASKEAENRQLKADLEETRRVLEELKRRVENG